MKYDLENQIQELKQDNIEKAQLLQKTQAFKVGDIFITTRNLSSNQNWIRWNGTPINLSYYPELREILVKRWNTEQPWKFQGYWKRKEIASYGSFKSIVTNSEWYLVLADYTTIYYTKNPTSNWIKKEF